MLFVHVLNNNIQTWLYIVVETFFMQLNLILLCSYGRFKCLYNTNFESYLYRHNNDADVCYILTQYKTPVKRLQYNQTMLLQPLVDALKPGHGICSTAQKGHLNFLCPLANYLIGCRHLQLSYLYVTSCAASVLCSVTTSKKNHYRAQL